MQKGLGIIKFFVIKEWSTQNFPFIRTSHTIRPCLPPPPQISPLTVTQ